MMTAWKKCGYVYTDHLWLLTIDCVIATLIERAGNWLSYNSYSQFSEHGSNIALPSIQRLLILVMSRKVTRNISSKEVGYCKGTIIF